MINKDFLMGYGAGKAAGGGGDISVVEKTITANGDYTAPSGKAFSPVHVIVPAPYPTFGTVTVKNMRSLMLGVSAYEIKQRSNGEYIFERYAEAPFVRPGYDDQFVVPVNQSGQQAGYIGLSMRHISAAAIIDNAGNTLTPYLNSSDYAVVWVENTTDVVGYTITVQ